MNHLILESSKVFDFIVEIFSWQTKRPLQLLLLLLLLLLVQNSTMQTRNAERQTQHSDRAAPTRSNRRQFQLKMSSIRNIQFQFKLTFIQYQFELRRRAAANHWNISTQQSKLNFLFQFLLTIFDLLNLFIIIISYFCYLCY